LLSKEKNLWEYDQSKTRINEMYFSTYIRLWIILISLIRIEAKF